jgi:hypothetical protein
MMIGGRRAITLIEQARPLALRAYDQIPMKADDLLFQARFIALTSHTNMLRSLEIMIVRAHF